MQWRVNIYSTSVSLKQHTPKTARSFLVAFLVVMRTCLPLGVITTAGARLWAETGSKWIWSSAIRVLPDGLPRGSPRPVAAGAPLGGEPPLPPQSAATLGPSHLCSEKSSVDLDVWPRKGGRFSGKEGDTGKMGVAVTYSSYCLLKSSKPRICGMGGRCMLRMFLRREGPADGGWDVGSAARAKSKDADLSWLGKRSFQLATSPGEGKWYTRLSIKS